MCLVIFGRFDVVAANLEMFSCNLQTAVPIHLLIVIFIAM